MIHGILIAWVIATIAILIVAQIVPGIKVDGVGSALVAAAILGFLNALVRPILIILTLPLTILTLGLFLFVLNALLFQLAGMFISGFKVDSFLSALFGSIAVSIISFVLHFLV
jgi:putative membrane protein